MRVFKSAWFERFARKQKIADETLAETVRRAEEGLIDANLGGDVIKQRFARPGQGRSGGFRAIILYQMEQRAFFVYGFAKSERDNIDAGEEAAFKKAARHVLGLSEQHLEKLLASGRFSEIKQDGQEIPK